MYIPKSQITQNQYTNGNEYVRKDTGEQYSGYYWKDSRGNIFTGKTPQDLPSVRLIESIVDSTETTDPLSIETEWLVNYNPSITSKEPGSVPLRYYPEPTDENYSIGEFQRYFTKKTNQNLYYEISDKEYKKLIKKDDSIQWQLYQGISLPWSISGDKEEVQKTNQKIVAQTSHLQKLPGFPQIFKGKYLQFYK